jgi:hypothetical protein
MGVDALLTTRGLWDKIGRDHRALSFIILMIDPKLAFKIIGKRRIPTVEASEVLKKITDMFSEPNGKVLPSW